MKIFNSIDEIKKVVKQLKQAGKTIGLVPTMGYLHEGHLSLMKKAKSENDVVIASVYVNPTQFGENEDLDIYPRDFESDSAKMSAIGVDMVFFPSDAMMYPPSYMTYVEPVGKMVDKLCAKSRPIHFRGVDTIVLKLFNITKADRAYFGMKDAQQVAVVKAMVRDLNLDVEIVPCPIVREPDGVAMSSRNKNLSEKERKDAVVLNRSLSGALEMIRSGETSVQAIIDYINSEISAVDSAKVDYIEAVDFDSFEKIATVKNNMLIALAVQFENARLIDNLLYLER